MQFAELEALPLREAEVPALDEGVVPPALPVEAPTDVPLPALPPLCAHAAASMAVCRSSAQTRWDQQKECLRAQRLLSSEAPHSFWSVQ